MVQLKLILLKQLRAAWRRKWYALGVAWVICALGWVVIARMPNQYESQARVYVDADAVLTPLLKGLAADTNAMSQVDLMQRTLLSVPNIDKLIRMTDLERETERSDGAVRERLIQQLQKDIQIKSPFKNLFTVSYRHQDPKVAQAVVQSLLTIFQEGNSGAGRNAMDNAQKFLKGQLATYEKQLRESERRRAEFRAQYVDILPSETGGASKMENARQSVVTMRLELGEAIARRDAIAAQLKSTSQTVATGGAGVGVAGAQQRLSELRLRLTEEHPDVVAAQKQLQQAKAAGGGGAITNPTYDLIKLKLVDAETQVAALKNRLAEAEKEQARIETIARQAPAVAAEYQNLDRDYTVIRKNYEELLTRREATNIAEAADIKADKIQFRVIDPPEVPSIPVAPKRILLLSGVLLAGIAASAALLFLLGQMDRSFSTLEDLRDLGLPVIGAISKLPVAGNSGARFSGGGIRAIDRGTYIFVAGAGALVVVYVLLLLTGSGVLHKVV